jgi:two-component system, OmpR family, sensor kinase
MSLYCQLSERLPAQHTTSGRVAVESALVCVGVVAVILCVDVGVSVLQIGRDDLHVVLALLAAAVGTAAAGLGHTAGRVAGNRRAAWLIPALALYSMDVVPDTAFPVMHPAETGAPSLGLLVDCATVAVLLVAALRPPGRAGPGWPWAIAVVGALVGLGLDGIGGPREGAGLDVSAPLAANLAVLVGWCVVSSAVVVAGYWTASPPLWRVGMGFGVVASAHVYRTVAGPFSAPSALFGALRLFGVFVVMLGMAQLLRRALNAMLNERFGQQEELRLATIHAEQAVRASVEREHELRNGLSGLAGITRLLAGGADDERTRRARTAAVTELHRLTELVDSRGGAAAAGLYCASEIVDELAALWRIKGMDLQASVPDGLMAVGRSSALAQVLTNLLVNCARHAPGAPVRIVTCKRGNRIVVLVRNEGTDLPADGRVSTAGAGVGLEISRRLLRDEGGELYVHPADPRWPGWTVSIVLVAAREQPDAVPTAAWRAAAEAHAVR